MYADTWSYQFFCRNPVIWRNLQLFRYRNSRLIGQIVSPDHHLVLEGFPRSGNSFSIRAFLHANGARRTWSVAHHFHKLPQVVLGVRWQRPTIVLMREPDAAVLSLMAHSIMKTRLPADDPDLHLSAYRNLFEHWQYYYETVHALRNHLVISDFSATTQQFDQVLEAANTRFESDFSTAGLACVATRDTIFETGGGHLSPNHDRDVIKNRLKDVIEHAALRDARDSARRTYNLVYRNAITV